MSSKLRKETDGGAFPVKDAQESVRWRRLGRVCQPGSPTPQALGGRSIHLRPGAAPAVPAARTPHPGAGRAEQREKHGDIRGPAPSSLTWEPRGPARRSHAPTKAGPGVRPQEGLADRPGLTPPLPRRSLQVSRPNPPRHRLPEPPPESQWGPSLRARVAHAHSPCALGASEGANLLRNLNRLNAAPRPHANQLGNVRAHTHRALS